MIPGGADFDQFVVIGDRVLIRPVKSDERTPGGLFLPPGVREKEDVRSGYIIKTGPGDPIPVPEDDEPWKDARESVRYIPLQIRVGDLAIYLDKQTVEVEFDGQKYVIAPQAAVLLVIRDEGLLE